MSETVYFPPVVSSEDETRSTVWIQADNSRYQQIEIPPQKLVDAIRESPDAIPGTSYMRNGGKVYNDSKGPEFAKPECPDPFELAIHSMAMDRSYEDVLLAYARSLAGTSGNIGAMIRFHRRVADSDLNTWACHDNVSIPGVLGEHLSATSTSDAAPTSPESELLVRHLMWRSFITGAGLVTGNGLRYAQKVDSVTGYNQYGFLSSYFRVDTVHGARLEARSSDRNLNNAAAVMRVGGTAILAALLQTPLVGELNLGRPLRSPTDGRDFNGLDLQPDGTIKPSTALIEAVDGEQRIAEYGMSRLPKFTEVPGPYRTIAEMWYRYCQDFRRVMAGEATIDLLADRSDWARKAQLIMAYVAEEPLTRRRTDRGARYVDQQYDATTILARGGKAAMKHGQGVQDQRDGSLPCTPDAEAVELARKTPPQTRAADRVSQVLAAKNLTNLDWHFIETKKKGKQAFSPTYIY